MPANQATHVPLFVDLYQLTMAQSYWHKIPDTKGTFELSFRSMPPNRGYMVVYGARIAINLIRNFAFSPEDLSFLRSLNKFDPQFLEYISDLSFNCTVRSMRDGEIVFGGEPIIQITGSIIQAQLLETLLINTINLRSILATKCSRVLDSARPKKVVDLGARRSPGIESAIAFSEAGHLVGFEGTASVISGINSSIPLVGTMAHSYVLAFPTELTAFRSYAEEFPENCTLLVDTFDSIKGIRNAIQVGLEMRNKGHHLNAIRLDSGNLGELATIARRLLDGASLNEVQIIVSGGLDEYQISTLEEKKVPIDTYGVGTKVGVSSDAPWADCIYKLVEVDGRPVMKSSEGKPSIPFAKTVLRQTNKHDMYERDLVIRKDSNDISQCGSRIISTIIRDGVLIHDLPDLAAARNYHHTVFKRLPDQYKHIKSPDRYPVFIQ